MIYPESFENKIGFDKIRKIIESNCVSPPAKRLVEQMSFSNNLEYIKSELAKTGEMLDIVMLKDEFPEIKYPDYEQFIKKLDSEDISLQIHEISGIKQILENIKQIYSFFNKDRNHKYSNLKKILKSSSYPEYVYIRINSILSKNDTIKDTASKQLKEIRTNLNEYNVRLNSKINSILDKIRKNGWIDTDLSPTIINGRIVLPINSKHKRKLSGIIHDESASGKTSYIEPQEAVELNNQIRELEINEKREINKILFDITQEIKPYKEDISRISEILCEIDFLRAKSRFSLNINAIIPNIDSQANPGVELVRAKHPLLYLALKKDNKELIPTNIKLDEESRIIVISGPNAGGKSVALKTVGLLVYMVQCGLPVPVGGASVFGIFDKVFIDMGDEQSIDNDLSTYSSHLLNIKYFLKNADEKTLLLIDEFGAGTDPILGGTIAEAVLEELNKKNAYSVITTHYSQLKIFAANNKGVENAAMMIDNNNMTPLFILEQGIPGSSYALEIAERIGLPNNIIQNIKEKSDNNNQDFDKFIRHIIRDKKYWERKRKNIRKKEKSIEDALSKHVEELDNIIAEKNKIINKTKEESKALLSGVNKKIENTIRLIKESKADKETTKKAREELEKAKNKLVNNKTIDKNVEFEKKKEKLAKKLGNKKKEIVNIDKSQIHIGSKVRIKGQTGVGEVVDLNEKNIVLCLGNIYTSIARDKVEKVKEDEFKKQKTGNNNTVSYNSQLQDFKPYIDIRGKRVEEAISSITDFIDNGTVLNFKELKILHGKGDGILRQHIRNYLRTFKQIKNMRSEDIRYGGDGITIIELEA